MAEPLQTYRTKVSGLWNRRHQIMDADGNLLGLLSVQRNPWGMVVSGEYRPEKGEVLLFRRDPGLLRAQFSLWTDGREWLGSSLRWNVARRQVDLWTGGRPYRLVPTVGFGRGWRLVASKTGEAVRIEAGLVTRNALIRVFRKIDFELVLFAYFLGSLTLLESTFPSSLDLQHHQDRPKPASTGA